MSSTIMVRRIDPEDKAWIRSEARLAGVSMEEFMRCLIRESREKALRRTSPSEAFRRYFGPEHGVELPARGRYGYRPVRFRHVE